MSHGEWAEQQKESKLVGCGPSRIEIFRPAPRGWRGSTPGGICRMRRITTLVISAVLLPGALALAACSSAAPSKSAPAASTASVGGNVGLSSAAANAAINAAAATATSLQVKGNLEFGGQVVSMNVQVAKTSSEGSMTISGVPISFLSLNGISYIRVTSAVVALMGGDPTAAQFSQMLNKWVPDSNSAISSFAQSFSSFGSLNSFIGQVASSSVQLTAKGTATVDGQAVAQYTDVDTSSTPSTTQIISIPASGPALPIQEVGVGAGNTGTMTFTWNQPVTIATPSASEIYSGS